MTRVFLNDQLAARGEAFDPGTGNGSYYFPQDEHHPLVPKGRIETVDGPQVRGTTSDYVKVTFAGGRPVSADTVEVTESNAENFNADHVVRTILNKMTFKENRGKQQAQYVVYCAKSDAEATEVANRFRGHDKVRVVNAATGFDTGEIHSPAQLRGLSAFRAGGGAGPAPS